MQKFNIKWTNELDYYFFLFSFEINFYEFILFMQVKFDFVLQNLVVMKKYHYYYY